MLSGALVKSHSQPTPLRRGFAAASIEFAITAPVLLIMLAAIIELFPNAPARTGAAVDTAVAKIENFLGDRDAPRIRALLAHVKDLRNQADAALASGDSVTALALNLRSMQILHRLVEHVRDHHRNHDEVADSEMEGVGS